MVYEDIDSKVEEIRNRWNGPVEAHNYNEAMNIAAALIKDVRYLMDYVALQRMMKDAPPHMQPGFKR